MSKWGWDFQIQWNASEFTQCGNLRMFCCCKCQLLMRLILICSGAPGFDCRCGNLFCGLHRYSDKHNCPYDYKAEAADKIRKENPVVVAHKIQRIWRGLVDFECWQWWAIQRGLEPQRSSWRTRSFSPRYFLRLLDFLLSAWELVYVSAFQSDLC